MAGPNLVLGNTVILKHAEITPQCAVAVEQLFTDAGAPERVFTNTILRIADVEQVIADPRIQGVTLTGSERTGSSVAALAGKHLTCPVTAGSCPSWRCRSSPTGGSCGPFPSDRTDSRSARAARLPGPG